jgi:hypothetical protein
MDLARPIKMSQLQTFLGILLSFHIAALLFQLLQKDSHWNWGQTTHIPRCEDCTAEFSGSGLSYSGPTIQALSALGCALQQV